MRKQMLCGVTLRATEPHTEGLVPQRGACLR
jgi:hypothetical protein